MKISPLTICCTLLFAGGIAFGADGSPKDASSKPSEKDVAFMKKAAIGGMAEVKSGEVAEKNGESAGVKEFGSKMVADHTKANEDLKQVATEKGVTLPEDVDAKHKETLDKMSAMTGAEFDKAYIADMVKDHKEDIADFEKESKMTKDTTIKGFVDKTLPTLKHHLMMIEKLAGGEKPAGKK